MIKCKCCCNYFYSVVINIIILINVIYCAESPVLTVMIIELITVPYHNSFLLLLSISLSLSSASLSSLKPKETGIFLLLNQLLN